MSFDDSEPAAMSEQRANRSIPPGTIRTLKCEGTRGVFLVRDRDGETVLAKRWPGTLWNVCKHACGIHQAQRQLRGARLLQSAGIVTPRARGRAGLTTRGGFAIEIRLEWIEGVSLLDRLSTASDAECRRLGSELATVLQRIEDAQLFHRDGKLSNFVVTPHGSIVVIDPVGVRRSRHRDSERARSLQALVSELAPQGESRHPAFFEALHLGLRKARGA
ncbi:MAG: hypothetical protein SGJ11_15785 [Phycisphaerae bacterium]|nr:hypothetical protein [Phycisphaerae bacterium]